MGISYKIPTLTQLESITFLSAVVKEGLRMHERIVARLSRVTPSENLKYKKWAIPPGTPISTSSVFIHRNPDIFLDPLEFKPERWLEKNSKGGSLDHYLVAFGKGTRNCVGLNLGSAEVHITLAHIAMGFEVELFYTDISDVRMVRDWYVPQPKLESVGVQARVVGKVKSI
ncbi:hypothetical protein G7Y89_g11112 [Cudoniella acicularis]|uniref:Cytochrome P450 n=1 Tax=Cudoniella acicularis TaxID=354080 RepID=A0A8H4W0Y5_9HELO|nr:hypothetical protein G7Y89_g11112 [Cudoniella acicularis]